MARRRKLPAPRRLPSGSWEARTQIGGVRYSKTFSTEAEARAFLKALEPRAVQATMAAPTLATFAPGWIDYREEHGLVTHAQDERLLLRCVVREWEHADAPLRAVKRRHVSDYIAGLAKQGELAPSTIKHRLNLIARVFDAAADQGKVSVNPARGVRVPRSRRHEAREAWTWLAQDEIDAVLACEYARVQPLEAQRSLYAVAIYAGLRRSELWHLTWSNVDLDGAVLRVRAPLKSPAARRDVPLLPVALQALKDWRTLAGRALHVWPSRSSGRRSSTDDGGWRDHPWGRGEERKVRRGLKSRAGIERHVRFHDLRHTCASHLVQGTWGVALSLYEARQWLGHSSIAVTQRYAHLAPGGVQDKVRALRPGRDG